MRCGTIEKILAGIRNEMELGERTFDAVQEIFASAFYHHLPIDAGLGQGSSQVYKTCTSSNAVTIIYKKSQPCFRPPETNEICCRRTRVPLTVEDAL